MSEGSFKVHIHTQCGLTILLSDAISIGDFLSQQISITQQQGQVFVVLCLCVNTTLHTDVESLGNVISVETFLPNQIAAAGEGISNISLPV
jgi:hypothetical protein